MGLLLTSSGSEQNTWGLPYIFLSILAPPSAAERESFPCSSEVSQISLISAEGPNAPSIY